MHCHSVTAEQANTAAIYTYIYIRRFFALNDANIVIKGWISNADVTRRYRNENAVLESYLIR